jgi:hypothetical protein
MEMKKFFFGTMCLAMLSTAFTACSDDDDPTRNDEGSQLELPNDRVFFLNEGSYNGNNAGITFYDPNGTTSTVNDIYKTQNNAALGDTGQDIIHYNHNLYVTVYGSQYITRLNEAGVEQARYAFTEEQGQPRYMAAKDGKIYVTLYSGNVARLDATTLQFEAMTAVGNNPEYIAEVDGKLYCTNSGWGYDNRLSIIDPSTFKAENVTIFSNPDQVLNVGDKLIIQGYGGAYPDYTYPVAVFNTSSKTYTQIGTATKVAGYGNTVYMVYSETDWSTYTTTNTFTSYDLKTNTANSTSFLKNVPEALATTSVYMLEVDPQNGDFYVGTSDYYSNGIIYRFDKDGNLLKTLESGGISPRKAVFIH